MSLIKRSIDVKLIDALKTMPAVALLGPRQVGKTTLARELSKKSLGKDCHYLDLELDSDFAKLSDAEGYLRRFENQLVIIDEVQLKPNLFKTLRSLIDIRRRAGEKGCQFLLLGSASRDLLQKTSETLAGRIRYLELTPFTVQEIRQAEKKKFNPETVWFRGGFPNSYLAASDQESWDWRTDFISTYIEKDIPLMGGGVSSAQVRRFMQMIAHYHGQNANTVEIGKSLGVTHNTTRKYIDALTDFYMLRQLPAWSGNSKKRLVKSPKIYVRDTGILHRLLNISTFDDVLGHPLCGSSWEGFVIESILNTLSDRWQSSYYRTTAKMEIDLILEGPKGQRWAVEIKKSLSPRVSSRFVQEIQLLEATKSFIIYGGEDRYPAHGDTEVIGLLQFLEEAQKADA